MAMYPAIANLSVINVGNQVTDDPATNHRGKVLEIRYNMSECEWEAYVCWHKGYSSWKLVTELTLKD